MADELLSPFFEIVIGEKKIRGLDWTSFADGDTVVNSGWIVPTGLTKLSDNIENWLQDIAVSADAGTTGKTLKLVGWIELLNGKIERQTLTVSIVPD